MIHYIILAHKDTKQIEELVRALYSPESKIYIHIDGYSDIKEFKTNYLKTHTTFIANRVKIRWGGFSIIGATLNSLKAAQSYGIKESDFIIIMSGQDFPLYSQSYIREYLNKYLYKSLIEYKAQPNGEWNILNRVIKYHFHDLIFPDQLNKLIEKTASLFYNIKALNLRNQLTCYIVQRVVNLIMPFKKYFIKEKQLYRGSQWQIISGKHAQYILDYLQTPPGKKLIKNFKYTAGPDEMFFQTLLLNSPYKNDIINEIQWFIDWKKGPSLPRILDESDYDNALQSGKLFVRKVDDSISKILISKIISSFKY